MNKQICVLGATGFIGRELYRYLIETEQKVVGLTRKEDEKGLLSVDYEDQEYLKEIFSKTETVVNCIGSYKPKDFNSDPEMPFDSMIKNLEKIDLAIKGGGIKRFIHISSGGTVYGENRGREFLESDFPIPTTWYGRMKLLEEGIVSSMCQRHGVKCVVLRLTNPFGNLNNPKHGFIDVLVSSILEKKKFTFNASKLDARDFIFIGDAVKIIKRIIDSKNMPSLEVYNVGGGKSILLKDIVGFIADQYGNVNYVEAGSKNDLSVVNVSIEKLKNKIDVDWEFLSPFEYISNELSKIVGYEFV